MTLSQNIYLNSLTIYSLVVNMEYNYFLCDESSHGFWKKNEFWVLIKTLGCTRYRYYYNHMMHFIILHIILAPQQS